MINQQVFKTDAACRAVLGDGDFITDAGNEQIDVCRYSSYNTGADTARAQVLALFATIPALRDELMYVCHNPFIFVFVSLARSNYCDRGERLAELSIALKTRKKLRLDAQRDRETISGTSLTPPVILKGSLDSDLWDACLRPMYESVVSRSM